MLIRLSNYFPPQDQGIISELQYDYNHRFELEDVRLPSGTIIQVSDVWLLEAFKIEDFETLKKGLRRILQAHPKRKYLSPAQSLDDVEKSLDEIRSSLRGGSWVNIGHIEPNQNTANPALPLVERIDFRVYAYFQNLAVLLVNITPSKEFDRRFQEIATIHCAEEHVFTWQKFLYRWWPFRRMFRGGTILTGYSLSASEVKAELFDALFASLKAGTGKYVAEFLPGYFYGRKLTHPSFELYVIEEPAVTGPASAAPASVTVAPATGTPATPAAHPSSPLPLKPHPAFWASLGLDRIGFRSYTEPTASAFLFDPWPSFGVQELEALPVRIMIDKKRIARQPHYYSLESQISAMVSDWIVGWAPLWALLNILYTIESRMPDRRDALFRYADSPWLRLWPLPAPGFRLDGMSDWFTFERLRGDFRLRDSAVAYMLRDVPQFSYTFFPKSPKPMTEEFTKRLLAEVREHIHLANKVFKMINFASNEVLQMTVVRSNFLLQVVMLVVAIASLIASIAVLKNGNGARLQEPPTVVESIGVAAPRSEPAQDPAARRSHAGHPSR